MEFTRSLLFPYTDDGELALMDNDNNGFFSHFTAGNDNPEDNADALQNIIRTAVTAILNQALAQPLPVDDSGDDHDIPPLEQINAQQQAGNVGSNSSNHSSMSDSQPVPSTDAEIRGVPDLAPVSESDDGRNGAPAAPAHRTRPRSNSARTDTSMPDLESVSDSSEDDRDVEMIVEDSDDDSNQENDDREGVPPTVPTNGETNPGPTRRTGEATGQVRAYLSQALVPAQRLTYSLPADNVFNPFTTGFPGPHGQGPVPLPNIRQHLQPFFVGNAMNGVNGQQQQQQPHHHQQQAQTNLPPPFDVPNGPGPHAHAQPPPGGPWFNIDFDVWITDENGNVHHGHTPHGPHGHGPAQPHAATPPLNANADANGAGGGAFTNVGDWITAMTAALNNNINNPANPNAGTNGQDGAPPAGIPNFADIMGAVPVDLGGLFGMMEVMREREDREDPVRARVLVSGLDAVPEGLVKRMRRCDELDKGAEGGGVGCAICWEGLGSEGADGKTEGQEGETRWGKRKAEQDASTLSDRPESQMRMDIPEQARGSAEPSSLTIDPVSLNDPTIVGPHSGVHSVHDLPGHAPSSATSATSASESAQASSPTVSLLSSPTPSSSALPVPDPSSTASANSTSRTSQISRKPLPRVVTLPCSHVFHSACLIPWFSRPRQTTCPACRFNIDPENLTYEPRPISPLPLRAMRMNTNGSGPGPAAIPVPLTLRTPAATASTPPGASTPPRPGSAPPLTTAPTSHTADSSTTEASQTQTPGLGPAPTPAGAIPTGTRNTNFLGARPGGIFNYMLPPFSGRATFTSTVRRPARTSQGTQTTQQHPGNPSGGAQPRQPIPTQANASSQTGFPSATRTAVDVFPTNNATATRVPMPAPAPAQPAQGATNAPPSPPRMPNGWHAFPPMPGVGGGMWMGNAFVVPVPPELTPNLLAGLTGLRMPGQPGQGQHNAAQPQAETQEPNGQTGPTSPPQQQHQGPHPRQPNTPPWWGPMEYGFHLRGTPSQRRSPGQPREKKPWTLPPPPGLSLRERVEQRERDLGLRCDDMSCGVAPEDDDPTPENADTKMVTLRSVGATGEGQKACAHKFHAGCLVSAERVAGWVNGNRGGDAVDEGLVQVACPVCRLPGQVDREAWDEGVKALA